MSKRSAVQRAREDARAGKKPSTQAGEFVREEMHRLHDGDGNVHSRKQAIAIGLSQARRAGVKLGVPQKGMTSAATRHHAQRDAAIAGGRVKVSPARSRAAKKAAQTRSRSNAGP